MRRSSICFVLCIFFFFPVTRVVWAQDLYVQSPKAPVWTSPSFQSSQVMEVTKGQRVEKLAAKGGWLQVRVDEKQGWMLKMSLSAEPPVEVTEQQQQALDSLAMRARRRSSAYATTAAARGLREKRQHFSRQLDMDFNALARMESWQADEQETANFLKKVRDNEKHP